MADNQLLDQPYSLDQQAPSLPQEEDMISSVMALDAILLPCLPAKELQAVDRSLHPSHHQIDVERHASEFINAPKELQLYFLSLQHKENHSNAETLRKEILTMEEELKSKTELINKLEKLVQNWRNELKEQLNKHVIELERA